MTLANSSEEQQTQVLKNVKVLDTLDKPQITNRSQQQAIVLAEGLSDGQNAAGKNLAYFSLAPNSAKQC